MTRPERTSGVVYLAGSGLRVAGWEAARRRRLSRLTEAESEELATAGTDRFLQLMATTDFADRRQLRLPLYQWPRDENIFRAVIGSFQEVVQRGLDNQVRRLEEPDAVRDLLRAFIRDPFGKKL